MPTEYALRTRSACADSATFGGRSASPQNSAQNLMLGCLPKIMPISRQKKEEIVGDLSQELSKRPVVLFVELKGIPVEEQQVLRSALKSLSSRLVVAKKTLARIAFMKAGIPVNPESFTGSLAFIFADDIVAAASELGKFAKTRETFLILGGILREADKVSIFSADEVKSIAQLPAKEVLLAQLLGVFLGPLRNLVTVLNAPSRNMLIVLNQHAKKGQ